MKKPLFGKEKLKKSIQESKLNIKNFMKAIQEEQKIILELKIIIEQHVNYEKWQLKQI